MSQTGEKEDSGDDVGDEEVEEEDGEDDDDDDDDDEEVEDDEDAEEENQRRYDFRQRKTVVRYQAPLDGITSTFLTRYIPVIAPFRVRVVIDTLEHGDLPIVFRTVASF